MLCGSSFRPPCRRPELLTVTGEVNLDHLGELDEFPLSRLVTAIQAAAESDHWSQDHPQNLLPATPAETITADQQTALAQSIIRRLVVDLPKRP